MRMQRQTFELILVTLITASILVVTMASDAFGGVLVAGLWGLGFLIWRWLNPRKKGDDEGDAS
ncbi:MAG: hypothetical protein PHI49_00110 [Halothiobacillaceae bacterium]|nr:hypothetical protein [Halothiobacillaceae bacterium]